MCRGDQRHLTFFAGADLLINDAQYLSEEYAGKRGWGHSTMEYVVDGDAGQILDRAFGTLLQEREADATASR